MKKLKFKIKKWLFKTFVNRYLQTVDGTLLNLFSKEEKNKSNKSFFGSDRANKERERIIKLLSSEKYKKFFFAAVKYDRNNPDVAIKPYGKSIIDRIFKAISIAYLYLFNRDLFERIQIFQKWTSKVSTIETQVNNYIATTTLDERADRAIVLGVVEEEKGKAQKRLRKIQSSRVEKILVHNQE
jgi:hypothetical protein